MDLSLDHAQPLQKISSKSILEMFSSDEMITHKQTQLHTDGPEYWVSRVPTGSTSDNDGATKWWKDVMVCSAVSTQYTSMSDSIGQTDRWRIVGAYTYCAYCDAIVNCRGWMSEWIRTLRYFSKSSMHPWELVLWWRQWLWRYVWRKSSRLL